MKTLLLAIMLVSAGSAFATPSDDTSGIGGIVCTAGNSGKHKRYWCHYPQGNFSNPQLLCVDVASIDGQGNNDHTQHDEDHLATAAEVENGCTVPTTHDDDCPTPSSCTTTIVHDAEATLEIEMGGYEDGLYVCGVEIVDHLCLEDDTSSNADFLVVGTTNYGKSWTIDQAPVLTTSGSSDSKTIKVHLNSFRFGSVVEVKYCYEFNRVVSGANTAAQYGYLSGYVNATLTDSDYIEIADLSAELSYSCYLGAKTNIVAEGDSGSDFLGPLTKDSVIKYTLPGSVEFDLSATSTGGCHFYATFTEGKIGTIRPLKADGTLYSGQIKTNVHLEMLLDTPGI